MFVNCNDIGLTFAYARLRHMQADRQAIHLFVCFFFACLVDINVRDLISSKWLAQRILTEQNEIPICYPEPEHLKSIKIRNGKNAKWRAKQGNILFRLSGCLNFEIKNLLQDDCRTAPLVIIFLSKISLYLSLFFLLSSCPDKAGSLTHVLRLA